MKYTYTTLKALGIATMLLLASVAPVAALRVGMAASSSVSIDASAAKLTALITKADGDITARISSLNDLAARVQSMTNVSADEKLAVSNEVQTNITGLTSLQTKIDADTDLSVAKTDAHRIFGDFRIYALVMPRGWILASTDRVTTITALMTTLSGNIQTRVTAAQSSGKDVSALTTLVADVSAKITDANTHSASAQASVTALMPDQGDKTKAASNHAALVAARADIKAAASDIATARKDIAILIASLKSLDGSASASASASTTVSQ